MRAHTQHTHTYSEQYIRCSIDYDRITVRRFDRAFFSITDTRITVAPFVNSVRTRIFPSLHVIIIGLADCHTHADRVPCSYLAPHTAHNIVRALGQQQKWFLLPPTQAEQHQQCLSWPTPSLDIGHNLCMIGNQFSIIKSTQTTII